MNIDKSNILTDILLKESSDDISIIKPLCVKLEKLESELKSLSDGTRSEFLLTDGSDSTRYNNYYNLLQFDFPEVNTITTKIKEMVFKLNGNSPFYLKMWYNIYRSGGYIGRHSHWNSHDSNKKLNEFNLISGHCFLYSSEPTSTTYYFESNKKTLLGNTLNIKNIPNIPGEITLFSSLIPHEFKKWEGDLRIGIAFDIILNIENIGKHEIKKTPLILIK
jgi:hypothetical protein